ncbi:MAG: DUF4230 domain-containing protein [Novosphingobium sp.]
MDADPVTRRGVALPWLIAVAALAAALWAWWPQQRGDVLSASLTAFSKQNSLTVFSAQLSPVVAAKDEALYGMLKSRQVAVIPARVDYTVDLSQVGRDRMAWDEAAQRLSVRLPPLKLSRPNLDEGHAQYLREGVWITRGAQDRLTQENTQAAESAAAQQAANPVLMELARSAAKDAVRQNLAIPLQVTGFGNVTVAVAFDGEKEEQ